MEQPKHVSILSVIMVRLRFVMLFVVVGFVVARWEWIMAHVNRATRPAKAEDAVQGEFEFYCPMHPSVVRSEMGNCPICGMGLSKRKRGDKETLPEGVLARLQLSPFRIRQAGVATVEAKFRALVREIRAIGFIEYDERRIAHLSARIAGRADELFINYTGTPVKKGDPVYSLYSPELISTQGEYLFARRTLDELKAVPKPDPEAVKRAQGLVDSTRERMTLWGITDDQIEEAVRTGKPLDHVTIHSPISGVVIEKDIHQGHYVEVGEDPYTIADNSVIWMQAEVFERDMGAIAEGQEVAVTTEAWPGEVFVGSVAFIYPTLATDTRTVKVRVEVPNRDGRLRPGMYATATIRLPAGKHGEVFYTCCEGCGTSSEMEGKCPQCSKAMVKRGGIADGAAPAVPEKPYVCPMHPEVVSDVPGKCPKCGMDLVERKVSSAVAKKVYVCDGHPEWVSDVPAKCPKCADMWMDEKAVPAGNKLVYRCPDHPVQQSDAPGKCTDCGKDLAYAIVAAGGKLVEAWVCPLDPIRTADGKLKCPDCGCEMKRLQYEEVLAVPLTSVIDTGERTVVYVDRGKGVFEAVEVMVGARAGEYYPVLSGLNEGDRVVTAGAFLLDSETRLNPAASAAYFGASGQETGKK